MLVKELFEEWMNVDHKMEIKRQTYIRYLSAYNNYIGPSIGELDIRFITKKDLQLFINHLKVVRSKRTNNYLSHSTIEIVIITLSLMFNYAIEYDYIDANPCVKIKGLPVKKKRLLNALRLVNKKKLKTMLKERIIPNGLGLFYAFIRDLELANF